MNLDSLADVLSEVSDPDTVERLIEPGVNASHADTPPIESLSEVIANLEDTPRIASTLTLIPALNNQSSPSPELETSLPEYFETYVERRRNRSPATISQYKRTLPDFLDFTSDHDVSHPAEITSDVVDRYIDRLFAEYEADATILTYTKNVRAWLNWLSKRSECEQSLCELLDKTELDLSPAARDEAMPKQQAIHIIQRHRRRNRGSAQHAIIELLYNAGPRIGELHSLDVGDVLASESSIEFRHRPQEGTRLKNGFADDNSPGDGERDATVKQDVVDALLRYIQTNRPDVTDDYGREPLFATCYGRASKSTLRRWIYQATSCRWANPDLLDATCDGTCDPDSNVCPYSYYPHAIRRGAIVNHLNGDLPYGKASERFDVSIPVIKKHYDPRTKQTRKQQRAEAVTNAWDSY